MILLESLKLLLPALIPSWRFFDVIAPSTRIEYSLFTSKNISVSKWIEFRAKPKKLSSLNLLKRIFWNPKWNESLYMVSCAEKILKINCPHSETEILNRIKKDLLLDNPTIAASHLQFRLKLIQRVNDELINDIVFISRDKVFSKEKPK